VRLTACSGVRVCARDVARCAARVVRGARDVACNAVRDALCSAARGELGAVRNARIVSDVRAFSDARVALCLII